MACKVMAGGSLQAELRTRKLSMHASLVTNSKYTLVPDVLLRRRYHPQVNHTPYSLASPPSQVELTVAAAVMCIIAEL
jgi:hypothetical protein